MRLPSESRVFLITRLTQRYDPKQDRIGLTVENAEKDVLVLWLTQRLANRLAGTLTGWLDDDVKAAAACHQTLSTVHSFEQWVAQAKMRRGRPVDRAASQGEALLNEVALRRGANGVMLTFRWGATGQARLKMDQTQLRQWLIILYRQYKRAGWSKDAWPNWITIGEENGSSSATNHEVN